MAERDSRQEWDRADVNKDGVVSDEEFSLELHDRLDGQTFGICSYNCFSTSIRQGKAADEIERLWQRYHQWHPQLA